jgi:signal transduction histidine kinase
MPKGGKITIAATQKDQQIELTVQDTGVGIAEADKPKLFKPLFTTKAKGQGFGLAVCKRLIEAQNGTIAFVSQKGDGTTFIIQLPTAR